MLLERHQETTKEGRHGDLCPNVGDVSKLGQKGRHISRYRDNHHYILWKQN